MDGISAILIVEIVINVDVDSLVDKNEVPASVKVEEDVLASSIYWILLESIYIVSVLVLNDVNEVNRLS